MSFVYNRRYNGPIQAVIFDWAGTTIDYGCYAPAVVFIEVFNRKRVPISIEEARLPMGTQKKEHIRRITQIERVGQAWTEVHGSRPSEEDVETMYQDFIPLQMDCLADYSDLIPGTTETIAVLRERGIKIGATTGYSGEMMDIVSREAKKRGYEPDSSVSSSDVPAGRPEPWMCFQNALQLGVFPMEAIIKVGDTVPDIEEGLNAGMWTVGVAKTGNEVGLNEAEIDALSSDEFASKLESARNRLYRSGAHYVVDELSDVPPLLDHIEARLGNGEKP